MISVACVEVVAIVRNEGRHFLARTEVPRASCSGGSSGPIPPRMAWLPAGPCVGVAEACPRPKCSCSERRWHNPSECLYTVSWLNPFGEIARRIDAAASK